MDAADVAWLRTAAGERAAREAASFLAGGATLLATVERLRRAHAPERARAAVALAEGRRAARRKFPDAERLCCDREAAEQASPDVVARWTAARFAGARRVADLGCGMGGDALAIADHAPVLAVDAEPGRAAMAEANAAARGLAGRVEVRVADVRAIALPADVDAAWLDPARRDGRGRIHDPRRWSPSLSDALALAVALPGAGIKLAPGIDPALLPADVELEFLSVDGDLVEAVAWLGRLARAARRATVLPAGATLASSAVTTGGGEPDPAPPSLGEPGRYLYDPDPAVGRAGLVRALARDLHAWQLDPRVAYLSSDAAVATPFARRFRVDAWLPFGERRLAARLAELGAGRVEVMRRGSPVETNALERRLNAELRGDGVRTVALTRVRGRPAAIVCERER